MKTCSLLVPLAVLAVACSTTTTDATVDALGEGTSASSLAAPPDPAGTCDPARIASHVDEALANAAARAAARAAGNAPGHIGGRQAHELGLLAFVYDADGSGTLEQAENDAIVSDFTAGCAAVQARMLAQWDANADGTLDADERATAKADADAHRPPAMEGGCNGDHAGGPGGRRPGGGHDGAGEPHDPTAPLIAKYDANADGTLDETELAAARADIRARIVAGQPPLERPAPPPADPVSAG